MPAKKVWIRTAEFADLIGVTKQRVNHVIQKGGLKSIKLVGGVRHIHAVKGQQEWNANLQKLKDNDKRKESNLGFAPKVDADGDVTLAEATRREKVFKAQQAELSYLEKAGKLIPVEKVQMEAFEIARKTRDALMAIPARHSHELAVETDPHKLEIALTKALQRALETLILEGEKDGSSESSEPLQSGED